MMGASPIQVAQRTSAMRPVAMRRSSHAGHTLIQLGQQPSDIFTLPGAKYQLRGPVLCSHSATESPSLGCRLAH